MRERFDGKEVEVEVEMGFVVVGREVASEMILATLLT